MNRQVTPNHCYDTEQGAYELKSAFQVDGTRDSPEWHVIKDGRKHRTFTSLMAAQGWLEHVLTYPQADKGHVIVGGNVSAGFKAQLAAALKGDAK